MCGAFACAVTTTTIGAVLVVSWSILGYTVVPNLVKTLISNELALNNDTEVMEIFEDIPFPINFTVRLFNVTNPEEVLNGGIPFLEEVGPYIYSQHSQRAIEGYGEDTLIYRKIDTYTFNAELSWPNSEDDMVTITNVAYHAVLAAVEEMAPEFLSLINLGMDGIFGKLNTPIVTVRIGDLLFDGLTICQDTVVVSSIACGIIRRMTDIIQNLEVMPDNSVKFSVLQYRNGTPSETYEVYRGIENITDIARVIKFDGRDHFRYWPNDRGHSVGNVSLCNAIIGTDGGMFNPFIDTNLPLYAVTPDICRSVQLRYEKDVVYDGIPAVRYTVGDWLFADEEGCYCLNVTAGLTQDNGCLYPGVSELYTCLGAYLVMSYPHFLYAHPIYQDGVLGLTPNEDEHRIFVEFEPNSGVVVRGAKRAQFNVFVRPVRGITATRNLRTTLTPILWVEEGVTLPEEYQDLITGLLLLALRLVAILVPVLIVLFGLILLVGIYLLVRQRKKRNMINTNIMTSSPRITDK